MPQMPEMSSRTGVRHSAGCDREGALPAIAAPLRPWAHDPGVVGTVGLRPQRQCRAGEAITVLREAAAAVTGALRRSMLPTVHSHRHDTVRGNIFGRDRPANVI